MTASIYPYIPSLALPIIFAVLVSLLALTHIYLAFIKYKWYHFGLMLLWASLVWIPGFIFRALSATHPLNVNDYIVQYVLVLAGPVLYAASEYFILGRLLAYLPYHAPIQPDRVLSTFLILSAAVEALTAAGASQVATSRDKPDSVRTKGLALIEAGLVLQAAVELCFFSFVALIEYRCRKGGQYTRKVRIVCYVLYTTSLMMLVRCIFRAVQGFQESACAQNDPFCSTIDRHEWFLWVFEVANVTVFVAALAVWHPGRFLPRDTKIYLDFFDGCTERWGPGYTKAAGDRGWFVTVMDPGDFMGRWRGEGRRVERFWEGENMVVGEGKGGMGAGRV